MTPDRYTNTEADAGLYERAHYDGTDDDRPSLSDLAEEAADATRALKARMNRRAADLAARRELVRVLAERQAELERLRAGD